VILFHFSPLAPQGKAGLPMSGSTPCMDILFIDEFRVMTRIGIHPREQGVPQALEISLRIGISMARAGESDDIRDTIDYSEVVERLRGDLERHHFQLLEKLAEHIAGVVLGDFGAVWVRVSIAKPGVMRGVRRAGVVIERGRSEAPSSRTLPAGE
jgi:dihydroneopterin aldolase